jgi:hypothetical protein
MTSGKWIMSIIMGTLALPALAEPLRVETHTSGTVTTLTGWFAELGRATTGAPVVVDFEREFNSSYGALDGNTFTLPRSNYFDYFAITAGDRQVRLYPPYYNTADFLNTIQLQNDVRNAAGELVDVFELTVGASSGTTVHYTTTTRLEYAASTFGDLDAWSILAVKDAPLLAGTIHLHEVAEGWDGTIRSGDMVVEVNGFGVQFMGPGAEVPAVPEPARGAMLVAGIAGVALVRRRLSRA